MQIVILSGGSGKRLWPFSNEVRSKQFLRLLPGTDPDRDESMLQRVVRQIREAGITSRITIATNDQQRDPILSQLGGETHIVTEPTRRDTFPAISLAAEYLEKACGCSRDETVAVIPCDQWTEGGYFEILKAMMERVGKGDYQLMTMGVKPTGPLDKYGYILPSEEGNTERAVKVKTFVEKPTREQSEQLIREGAFWNAGVYVARLGFFLEQGRRYLKADTIDEIRDKFACYPCISFDYEVAEKTPEMGMAVYDGKWKDLGTWESLLTEIGREKTGRVSMANNRGTYVLNELQIPILCVGTSNLIIAASPDGILISDRKETEMLKEHTGEFHERPMYEERRWGTYMVMDHTKFNDGYETLTKRLTLNPGKAIGYQSHRFRDETWTFIDGQGLVVTDGKTRKVSRGDTVHIRKGEKHALYALTPLTFIEVQAGSNLVEEDIERFNWDWDNKN